MNQILEVVNTSPALVLAGGGVFAVILLLLFIVMRQGKQINKLELQAKPQYGFLGKPLYAVMIMALVAGGVGITLYSQGSLAPDDTSATKEVVAEISVTVIEPGIPEDRVQFSAVPMVGELEWGEPNDIFDLVWTINGPKDFSEFKFECTRVNTCVFTRKLPPGDYNVRVDVTYLGKTYTSTSTLSL